MALSASTNISVTIAKAIAYLTRPLIISYSATTIIKLQLILEANLTAHFTPHWDPKEPLHGSGRRSLTLSPNCLPPRPIYAACLASGVQWFDWIALLGGREFDFFVDPGCVSVRMTKKENTKNQFFTVWADESPSPTDSKVQHRKNFDEDRIQAQIKAQADSRAFVESKTLAQQLLEEDIEEDEQLFAMIADEVSAPTWMTPILDQFPTPVRSSSPLTHSRSSSRSSNSSSGFSLISGDSSLTSTSNISLRSSKSNVYKVQPKQSRREKARQSRVFVDTSKNEVTPYDGGKTTVLTGGVMLGGGPSGPKTRRLAQPIMTSDNWRASRS